MLPNQRHFSRKQAVLGGGDWGKKNKKYEKYAKYKEKKDGEQQCFWGFFFPKKGLI